MTFDEENFNKRWNIKLMTDPSEEFNKFKQRVINSFKQIDSHLTKESIHTFCQILGFNEEWRQANMYSDRIIGNNVITCIYNAPNTIELCKMLEIISSLEFININLEKRFLIEISTIIKLSHINVSVKVDSGKVVFYPSGEKILDEKLINESLAFLEGMSLGLFESALTDALEKKLSWRSLESLRKTLEEYLKSTLNNNKNLSTNINEILRFLNNKDINSEIKTIIASNLNNLDKYFNENSKHKTKTIEIHEFEFILYQTSLILRYINQVDSI